MARKPYAVVINGIATTLLLDDAGAERLGVLSAQEETPPAPAGRKARTPRNKQRAVPNKGQ